MIGRRDALFGIGAMFAASSALAQPARRLPVVALVLGTAPVTGMVGPDPSIGFVREFVHGLRDLGWIDGRTVKIERHSAEGDIRKAEGMLKGLAAARPDVIVTGGERWLVDAAVHATQDIPIVANLVFDPVAAGLIAGFARPGNNLTGVTRAATGAGLDAKALQFLLDMDPRISRIGFLAGPSGVQQLLGERHRAGVAIIPFEVGTPEQLETALDAVGRAGIDGLILGADGPVFFAARRISAFAAEKRIPAIYGFSEAITMGGLMAYGTSTNLRWRQIAKLAARFLEGARIGEVPVEHPTAYGLVINGKAAAALGLTVPPALAAQADEVIE
jgi:putative ABC transport system substrate-binding protein